MSSSEFVLQTCFYVLVVNLYIFVAVWVKVHVSEPERVHQFARYDSNLFTSASDAHFLDTAHLAERRPASFSHDEVHIIGFIFSFNKFDTRVVLNDFHSLQDQITSVTCEGAKLEY